MKTTAYSIHASAPVQSQVVTPFESPVMRVASNSMNLDPSYVQQIENYGEQRTKRVIENFIENPVLLSSFYELLGMLPYEIEDIQKNVKAKKMKLALIETDDLIEKLITWRIKLSHKFSV